MNNPPHFKGYRPIGLPEENSPVVINFEEYEAIRLSDFELHGHVEASKIMGVSRPTYTRIYESARRKVAQAFVQGKAIVFEGGKVYFDSEWYSCNSCGCWFNHPEKTDEVSHCTLCGSTVIEQYHQGPHAGSTDDLCVCPTCGFEKVHLHADPCKSELCPNCSCQMISKEAPQPHRLKNNNCKQKNS
jgi:predicted DNA-binding protein (UPF0251 family)